MNNRYKIIRDKKDTLYLLCLSDDVMTLCHMFVKSFFCVVKKKSHKHLFSWTQSHVYHHKSLEILELKIELISVAFYNDNNK